MGGFECSTHRRRDGRRLDLIAGTRHDTHALADYRQLAGHGLRTLRDGVRWHLIEPERGRYDWSSLAPMVAAAREAGVEVIWDLMHYGWPDWTNPWDAEFVGCFADFAEAVARVIGPGGRYVPVNEISFLAWGGGDVGYLNPFMCDRGDELKHVLCRAAIAATRRIRAVDPAALLVCAEPLIRVHPVDDTAEAAAAAAGLDRAQFDAIDCLLGRRFPEFGGSEAAIDVIGVNYYPHNQWYPGEPVRHVPPEAHVPLHHLLVETWQRYRRPVFVAETGCEGEERPGWLRGIAGEVAAAQAAGADLRGICLYPILDHPGWDDDRACPNGLLCGIGPSPRVAYEPLAAALDALHREVSDPYQAVAF